MLQQHSKISSARALEMGGGLGKQDFSQDFPQEEAQVEARAQSPGFMLRWLLSNLPDNRKWALMGK